VPSPSASEQLNVAQCAELLGLTRLQVWWWVRSGQFAAPMAHDAGKPRWRPSDVLTWAAESPWPLSSRVPLRWWPTASDPGSYGGVSRYGDAVVQEWRSDAGTIALVWQSPDGKRLTHRELLNEEPDVDALIEVEFVLGIDGPSLRGSLPALPDRDAYPLRWSELSRVLGVPVPYWAREVRIPALIEDWRPNDPAAEAAAAPAIDVVPLLRLAAVFDEGTAASRVLINLARAAQDQSWVSAT
jgi:predicted DNA-binding transcriptional regulator AlpA